MSLYSNDSEYRKRMIRKNRELARKYHIKDFTRPEGAELRDILGKVFAVYVALHMIYIALKSYLW